MSKRFKYWLPPLLWMLVIFSASSDAQSYHHSSRIFEPLLHWLFPTMPMAHIQTLHHLVRKCAHMTEYAFLAWLFWRAIRQSPTKPPRPWNWSEAGLALALVFIYAAADELHQKFIPGRTGQISDVIVDVVGGAIGLTLLWAANLTLARVDAKSAVTGSGQESGGC
jgi:VanZ family protein